MTNSSCILLVVLVFPESLGSITLKRLPILTSQEEQHKFCIVMITVWCMSWPIGIWSFKNWSPTTIIKCQKFTADDALFPKHFSQIAQLISPIMVLTQPVAMLTEIMFDSCFNHSFTSCCFDTCSDVKLRFITFCSWIDESLPSLSTSRCKEWTCNPI